MAVLPSKSNHDVTFPHLKHFDRLLQPNINTDDQRDVQLDKSGTRRVTVKEVPASSQPASIYSEMEFTDPSGEIHAASATVLSRPLLVAEGRFAMVHDIIHERYPKHGAAYFMERERQMRAKLAETPPAETKKDEGGHA